MFSARTAPMYPIPTTAFPPPSKAGMEPPRGTLMGKSTSTSASAQMPWASATTAEAKCLHTGYTPGNAEPRVCRAALPLTPATMYGNCGRRGFSVSPLTLLFCQGDAQLPGLIIPVEVRNLLALRPHRSAGAEPLPRYGILCIG